MKHLLVAGTGTARPEPLVPLVRLFDRHQGELSAFFTTMVTTDMVAPSTASRTLAAHYHALGGAR